MILCVSLNPAIDKMLKIDEITIGGVSRARLESVHAGGKAINVASNLLLQGDSVKVTGYVGELFHSVRAWWELSGMKQDEMEGE